MTTELVRASPMNCDIRIRTRLECTLSFPQIKAYIIHTCISRENFTSGLARQRAKIPFVSLLLTVRELMLKIISRTALHLFYTIWYVLYACASHEFHGVNLNQVLIVNQYINCAPLI